MWIGCGRWQLAWHWSDKEKSKSHSAEPNEVFIVLYLYSADPSQILHLMENASACAAFLAALYLKAENATMFYSLAEERYEDIR